MSNVTSSFYRRLITRLANIRTAVHILRKRGPEILHLLEVERQREAESRRAADEFRKITESNPTCRIMSSSLRDVVLGEHVTIHSGTNLDKVNIGEFSFIASNSIIRNVDIGKFCSIGPDVKIGLDPHPSRVIVSTYPAFYSNDNVGCFTSFRENKIFNDAVPRTVLANDIWIGSDAIIPGGIQIGTGAIVAAGAIVVKDIPPYAVVGGNPAKIIRYRFTEEQIKSLLESEWWDWPIEKIRQKVDGFSDIGKFLDAYPRVSDGRRTYSRFQISKDEDG